MNIKQEPKYNADINGSGESYLYNRYTGSVIPEDEPVFILRAKDNLAVDILFKYIEFCDLAGVEQSHIDFVKKRLIDFEKFANNNSTQLPTTPK